MQAGTTQDFVRLAKSRPMPEDRQKAFAVARTQAQLKIDRADAEALVNEVWDQPLDSLRVVPAPHVADLPAPDVSTGQATTPPPVDQAAPAPPPVEPPPEAETAPAETTRRSKRR